MKQKTDWIYPGAYQPPVSGRFHRKRDSNGLATPKWDIVTHGNCLLFRCWIPGAKREDIELTIRNHRLFLSAHASLSQLPGDSFSTIRYNVEIPLPWNADPSWCAAEYHRGLLSLRFSLSDSQYLNGELKVVVY